MTSGEVIEWTLTWAFVVMIAASVVGGIVAGAIILREELTK